MEGKRVSMRQIARECGCSVATVSYALNRSGQAKISSATRLRIIETAKRLNYSPSRTARSRPGRAAILVTAVPGGSVGRRLGLMDLAWELTEQLRQLNIPAAVLEIEDLAREWRQVYAISPDILFILDGGSKPVARLDPPCVQPIVFVDSDNSDPLYYKILPDYPSLMQHAAQLLGGPGPFLVTEAVRSAELRTLMTRNLPPENVFINDGGSLAGFLNAHRGQKGVVVGDLLAVEVCRSFPARDLAVISALDRADLFPPDLTVIPIPNRTRAAAAVTVARDLLTLKYDPEGDTRVLLKPKP